MGIPPPASPGYDFAFFWMAARAILSGQSPYTVSGFFSPYPFALLLTPLALLPFGIAYGVWTALKLFLLLRATDRWSFLRALIFVPVAFELWQGQLDLLVVLLASRLNWVGAVICTLRPQLAIFILPYLAWTWWKDKRRDQFWKAGLGILVLYGLATLIVPAWWSHWLNARIVAQAYSGQSASLFGLAWILPNQQAVFFIALALAAAIVLVASRPLTHEAFWQIVALFNPVANAYSLSVLFSQLDWIAILLGLLALPLSGLTHTNATWAIVPLYLMFKRLFMARRPQPRAASTSPGAG